MKMTSWHTPPQIARRYGIGLPKVLGWIKRGELRAVNVADRADGQPRFRVSPTDLAIFEQRRSATPEPKVTRRRRRLPDGVIQFFGPRGERMKK